MTGGFTAPQIDWAQLAPIIIVLGAGVVGVLVEAFVPRGVRRTVQLAIALVATAGALIAVSALWAGVAETGGTAVVGVALARHDHGGDPHATDAPTEHAIRTLESLVTEVSTALLAVTRDVAAKDWIAELKLLVAASSDEQGAGRSVLRATTAGDVRSAVVRISSG